MDLNLIAVAVVVAVAAMLCAWLVMPLLGLWIQSSVGGAGISLYEMIGMRFRKVDVRNVLLNRIRAVKSGLDISTRELETLSLAGGDVSSVVTAMMLAKKEGLDLTWNTAIAVNLAGGDIVGAVRASLQPRVIECPGGAQRSVIEAVAADGVAVRCRARVTVCTNINRFLGGSKEDALVERIAEALAGAIEGVSDHARLIEDPGALVEAVMASGADAGSALQILSVEIVDLKAAPERSVL